MSAEEKLIRKIADRIDNDNSYDNLLMAKDIAKVAREYHAKEMERVLGDAEEWINKNHPKKDSQNVRDALINSNANSVNYGCTELLTHLKEQKQDKG